MRLLIIISLLVKLGAAAWWIVLLRRFRDWRVGLLSVLLLLLAARGFLRLADDPRTPATQTLFTEFLSLAISITALLTVFYLGQLLRQAKQAESRATASERRLRAMLDAEPECVKLLSADGSLLDMNPAGLRMIEADSINQVANQCVYPLIVDEHRDAFRELTERVFRGESGTLEFEIGGLKGGRLWLETHACPLRGERGEIDSLLAVTRDITDRKRAEDSLRTSEERFRMLFENNLAGVFSSTIDGRCKDCNDAFVRMLRFDSKEQLLSRPAVELYPSPADRERYIAELQQKRALVNYEIKLRCRDGSFIWGLENVGLVSGADGTELIQGTIIDVTEWRKAKEALLTSEERLRLALDSAQMGTFDWDVPNNRITWSHWHEALWGFAPGEFNGTYEGFSERVHPEDLPALNAEVNRCIGARDSYTSEFRVLWPDGSEHWMRSRGKFSFDTEGRPVRMRGIVKEITESKRSEQALRDSLQRQAMLSRRLLAAQEVERRIVARELHDEIGQVLTAVQISVQQALQVCAAAAQPRLAEAQRITSQAINQVRDISLNLRPAMLDDFGLVPALRWYLDRQQRHGDSEIVQNLQMSGIEVGSDVSTACYRIVQEAVTNAQRHARAQHVEVDLREADGELQLVVRDDGVGVDAKEALDGAFRGVSFGVLGMRERAELLGGRFEFRSAAGKGTTVLVCLPVMGADGQAAAANDVSVVQGEAE